MKSFANDDDSYAIFCFGMNIEAILELTDKNILLDNYYNAVHEVYQNYKPFDDLNCSLIESINNYIEENADEIMEILRKHNALDED